ncbi:MAG TPA: hypothetical protein VLJ39_07895 [Tepidisphaeraceae bacterium]|nr:hypothetical protein [Tepidisphaeraceae bacterium]
MRLRTFLAQETWEAASGGSTGVRQWHPSGAVLQHSPAGPLAKELERVRESLHRVSPFGSRDWVKETADQLGLGFTLRPRGRPRNRPPKAGKERK